MNGKSSPKFKFKVGRVNCDVWQNGDYHNVTFRVSYKKEDNSWDETDSFSKNDLPALASAAQYAVNIILGEEAKR